MWAFVSGRSWDLPLPLLAVSAADYLAGLVWSGVPACQDPLAASYCSTTLAGMRPRALTAMPWSFAHVRIPPLRSRLDAVRPGVALYRGVK